MLTIELPSVINGNKACMPSIGPVRLTASAWFQSGNSISPIRARIGIPALFTSPWTVRPASFAASAAQSAGSATSRRQ